MKAPLESTQLKLLLSFIKPILTNRFHQCILFHPHQLLKKLSLNHLPYLFHTALLSSVLQTLWNLFTLHHQYQTLTLQYTRTFFLDCSHQIIWCIFSNLKESNFHHDLNPKSQRPAYKSQCLSVNTQQPCITLDQIIWPSW